MGLSHDIISEFVRITNDKKEKPKEGIVYGVVAQTSDGNYVKIDGSDLITPAETTTEVQDGERVTVMIKDHTATITGNVTSPSANSNSINKKFESVSDKIGTFELIVADKISANELEVYKATIDVLIAGKATIQDLEVVNATIEHLYAQNATIENLVANKASIKDLDVVNATIENLKAKDAEIEHAVIDHLEATLADIKVLNADFAQIRTLVNGNLTSDNILSFNITSDKVTMEDAFIKDAMIANVSAAKINAGKINTNNVTIGSEDGGMLITGSTQQFVDKDGNVRIQIGRDAKGDFTFILYGEDGVGQLINQNGITASAISDGLIVNDMVSDKAAISGEKLDISSVITEINNDNSTTIKSNKIYLNEQEQSLEVAFNSLKTQVETIKDITVSGDLTSVIDRVQANTTEIEVNKERINTLILEDSIIKKQVTDLEGDVVETSTTLASKYSELDQTIEGFKTSVADTYATKSTVNDISNNLSTNYSTTSAMNSAIEQKVDEINLSISETYATNETVNDINDNLLKNYSTTSVMNSTINQKVDEITLSVSETYATISSVDGINDKLLTEYPTITQMDSAITQKADEIALTVAKKEIENIQVGGTNLLGSHIPIYGLYHIPSFVRTGTTSFEVIGHVDNDGTVRISNIIDGNGWYTISFDVKCQIEGWGVDVEFCDGKIKNFSPISTTDYTHCVYSYEVANYTSDIFNFIDIYGLSSQTFWFKNIKVEKGKIATDYSPCPSDYPTTTEMNSAITQKADEINLSVSQTINNIQTGGKNLIKNGNFENGVDSWFYERFSGVETVSVGIWNDGEWVLNNKAQFSVCVYGVNDSNRTGEWTLRQGFNTVIGQTYTISYLISGHRTNKSVTVKRGDNWADLGSKYYGEILGGIYANNWTYDSITFVAESTDTGIWFSINEIYTGDNGYLWVTDVCCVEGSIPHRFTPNIDEYSTTTQMNSAITQKADEINLTVNKMKRGSRIARWVRCYMYGNTWNTGNHIVQVQVWSNGTNLALGKIPYSNGVLDNPDRMTDGNLDTNSYAELHPNGGDVYWEIDLGDEYSIDDITLWNYYGDSRKYHYILVTYDHNWEQLGVYNTWVGGTYVETSSGKNFVLNSSTINNNLAQIDIKADSIKLKVDAVDSDLKNNYPTTTQMNSAIQLKADSITSAVNMTSIAGVELMPQSHRGNSTSGYYVHVGSGQLHVNEWGLYVTGGSAWVSSDFIAIDPGLPLKYYFFMQNINGHYPLTYLGFEQYNWLKQEIGTNASTIYVVQEKFTGYKSVADTLPENSFNSNTKYIKLRWLTNWDEVQYDATYLHDISVKQLGSINQSTQIAQMSDKIESTVSSVNVIGGRVSTAESKITQNANSIATKVDVNGVKSTIQQNPESVRIGFNGISNYFDLNSTRLQVGHSDGSYTQIGQNGVTYYANGSGNRYHNLMKQGWTETVAMSNYGANGWSLIVTLPPEFRGKVFSVIPCLTHVSCPNLADAIKGFEVNIPQETVNYNQGSFVIHLYASGLWAEGLSIHHNVQIRMTWIAIA